MKIVLPFYSGDLWLCLKNLQWIQELDGHLPFAAVLACDTETDYSAPMALANQIFAKVDVIQYPKAYRHGRVMDRWPWQQNNAFANTARSMARQKDCWLWLETDSVPMQPKWAQTLEADYLQGGKPFGGHWNGDNGVFNGVAIYPDNVSMHCSSAIMASMLTDKEGNQNPWDVHCSKQVYPKLYIMNHLMQHMWNDGNAAPNFVSMDDVKRIIRPGVILFHRCKNGSLIEVLRKSRVVTQPQVYAQQPALSAPLVNEILPPKPVKQYKDEFRVVSLRRAGDIIALLPLLKKVAEQDKHVRLVVHEDYKLLLDGTSYVDPIIWNGGMEDPEAAAKKHNAINAQVYGNGKFFGGTNENFASAAWTMLGQCWNRYYPLVFDQRNLQRESKLAEGFINSEKPVILMNLKGISSPFSHADLLHLKLQAQFGQVAQIVNLGDLRAERLYDVLGLMDRASVLISVDTYTLHLNRGHKIPTVALVNPKPIAASPDAGNVILRVPYEDVPKAMDKIMDKVKLALLPNLRNTDIVLIHSEYKSTNPAVVELENRAKATWERLGATVLHYQGGRATQDKYAMPYIHDMVQKAIEAGMEEIIAITNNDIQFDPRLRQTVIESCQNYGCYWSHRKDPLTGQADGGVDFVAFTRKWWHLHKDLFPDFILGCIWWDDIISRIMVWSGCRECEGLYYHVPHRWGFRTRSNSPGMKEVTKLATAWLDKHNETEQKPIALLK